MTIDTDKMMRVSEAAELVGVTRYAIYHNLASCEGEDEEGLIKWLRPFTEKLVDKASLISFAKERGWIREMKPAR